MNSGEQTINADLLIHAAWIIPATDDQAILDNHAIAVHDGRIVAILPSKDCAAKVRASRELQLPDQALIPGMVNAHGHAAMSLLRGIADDLPLMTWLQDYIWPLESKWVSEEFVYHGTQLAIAEMLRGGTTCFADMYFFPDASAKAATETGMRVQLAAPVIDFPTPWAANAEEGIAKTTALHDNWKNSELVSTAFGPHAPYSVSDEPLRKIAALAEKLDIPIHMHVHETAFEVEEAVRLTGVRPMQRLYDLGLLSPRLLCVHATQVNDEDLALLKQTAAHVIHCPESNLKLASGFCPVARLLASDVNVAIGTDGAASNNDLDMFSEMRTAAMLAKACSGDAAAVPAYQALQMATINGAKAMGLDQKIGTLEVGKCADITAVRLDSLNTLPLYNPVSQLVYSTQSNQVSHVWINGKLLLDNGELTSLNVRNIREQTLVWQQRLKQSAEKAPDSKPD
jgi:5-methylthioadenosine/S-adenosylhomocysteine deaminase